MRRHVRLCTGTNIPKYHATYNFSADILLGILWRREQQSSPKLWRLYTNVHITISKKGRVFASTTVGKSNLVKYNSFLVSALPTAEDQDPRRLLLLYQWCSERKTRPRRALCPYGVVYGQSHKVSRNTYGCYNFNTANGSMQETAATATRWSPHTKYLYSKTRFQAASES